MSGSEPETPKPEKTVEQEVSKALDNLKAENKKLVQKLAERDAELATVTADRDKLQGQLAELATVQTDRDELRSQLATVQAENEALKQTATENTRYYAGVMNEAGANLGILKKELEEARSQLTAGNQKISDCDTEIEQLKSKIQTLQSKPPEPEQQPAPAINLPEQVGEIVNFLKQSLPPDTKWPKRIIPELRKFLEAKED